MKHRLFAGALLLFFTIPSTSFGQATGDIGVERSRGGAARVDVKPTPIQDAKAPVRKVLSALSRAEASSWRTIDALAALKEGDASKRAELEATLKADTAEILVALEALQKQLGELSKLYKQAAAELDPKTAGTKKRVLEARAKSCSRARATARIEHAKLKKRGLSSKSFVYSKLRNHLASLLTTSP